jgi:hypothetical protein
MKGVGMKVTKKLTGAPKTVRGERRKRLYRSRNVRILEAVQKFGETGDETELRAALKGEGFTRVVVKDGMVLVFETIATNSSDKGTDPAKMTREMASGWRAVPGNKGRWEFEAEVLAKGRNSVTGLVVGGDANEAGVVRGRVWAKYGTGE